ncbi:hypothetical protein C5167_017431 [Papaver somniferum]|uniref:Profilin n=1 Tax=Papaver somniferum TaxID=3469 RepID=A0A4Y7IJF0_PAPSO|nr:hypothetical protein C5167_017431 [Papaver somniferum]
MDWGFAQKVWEKWASNSVGSSGEPLKAALLLNYDPTGPSRLMSVIAAQQGILAKPVELCSFLEFIKLNNLPGESFFIGSNDLTCCHWCLNAVVEDESSSQDPNQDIVTSIHETWFCARSLNTSRPAGEGAIVMQTASFLLIGMYDGSIGAASRAMVAVDQFSLQLSRKHH